MKIVIDGRMLSWTGIGRYTQALLEQIQVLDNANDYIVLLRQADAGKWKPKAKNFRAQIADIEPYGATGQFKLERALRRLEPDLVHFPHLVVPIHYHGRFVTTIHDFTLLDFQNLRGGAAAKLKYRLKQAGLRAVLDHAVRGSARIITHAEYTRDQILKRYGVSAEVVTTIPLAADRAVAEPAPTTRLGIKAPFLLYVGNHYPYKNIGRLIEALAELDDKFASYQLVITGKRDYFHDQLEQTARTAGVAPRVIFTGYVSDGELVSLYRAAALYCFPSLSEGFGLPGLEAMAQGTPVISSRETCLPEVYGDAASYFRDALDSSTMASDITALLSNETQLKRLRQAGPKRVSQFSWKRTAERTLAVYHQALDTR